MHPECHRLEVRKVSKTFGSARVLTNVEITVLAGEIHGLAGQNGSGKSTLIKILTGVYTPDAGAHYEVDGNAMRLPVSWRQVHAAGVSVVHQDLGLLDQLSIADNICVGGYPTTSIGRIDRTKRDRLAARTLDRLGVQLKPETPVGVLTAAERAEVAIARAMRDHTARSGLVILDESTRSLNGADLLRIHALLRRITAEGAAVVVVSHNLAELMDITNRVTVLRDGLLVGRGLPTQTLTESEIARCMVGSSVTALPPRAVEPGVRKPGPALKVTGLSSSTIRNVSFALGPGEIVGITGLPGSGYEDIPYLVTGVRPATAGVLTTGTRTVNLARGGVAACIRAGVVLVPERRDRDGLAFELNVRDNITLPSLRERGRVLFVGRHWQQRMADSEGESLDIMPRRSTLLVKQLSGGNQQKVMLAKWLTVGPKLLVLHEPTQAVDIGARQDIIRAIRKSADSGIAVLLVSSEPQDLVSSCDRILLKTSGGLTDVGAVSAAQLLDLIYETPTTTAEGE